MTTKYLLAKYIADLSRFEPKNIGVIVYSSEGIAARFLAEYPDRPSEVDGRSIPAFVTSDNAYRQWIQFWRAAIIDGGASKNSRVGVIDELVDSNRGNFVLAPAGELLDEANADDLPIIADQLFASLVEMSSPEEPRNLDFDTRCDALLMQSGLASHPCFTNSYTVQCDVNGILEDLTFSHAMTNGTLQRLYQRWPLPKRKRDIQRNLHDTTWRLERIVQSGLIDKTNAVVIVDATREQLTSDDASQAFRILETMSHVINIQNETEALNEFTLAASIPVTDEPHVQLPNYLYDFGQ